MHKVLLIFFIAVLLVLFGCFKLNEGGESECFPYIRINFMSTSDIDSVQFYLNGEQVCIEEANFDGLECLNCEKGMRMFGVLCRISEADDFFSSLTNDKECVLSEDYPIWRIYECLIDEREKRDIDSSRLDIYVHTNNGKKNVEPDFLIQVGNHYNIMFEEDAARWNSYSNSTMNAYYRGYGLSKPWTLDKCHDGFCFASKSTLKKEFCYEK